MRAAIHPAGIPVMSLVILLLSQCVNQMFAQRFSHTAALPRQQFGVSSSDNPTTAELDSSQTRAAPLVPIVF